MTAGNRQTKNDFEAKFAELEKVVAQLEGEVKLEQALELFDRGIKLSTACGQFLQQAERKVEILKQTAEGLIETEPFADEEMKQ